MKSVFTRPMDGAILRGAAVCGQRRCVGRQNRVQEVEISTDGGAPGKRCGSPHPAVRTAGHMPGCLWEYDWKIPGPGKYSLAVRAKDGQGRFTPPNGLLSASIHTSGTPGNNQRDGDMSTLTARASASAKLLLSLGLAARLCADTDLLADRSRHFASGI